MYCGDVEYKNPGVVPSRRIPDALTVDLAQVTQLGMDQAMKLHVQQHHRELLFLKSKDWQQEREYRWAVKSDSLDEFFVPLEESLIGIMLGDRFPIQEMRPVYEYGQGRSISLARTDWSNGFPQASPTHWRILRDSSTATDRAPSSRIGRMKRAICRALQKLL
jgi:hypothetical protein